MEPTDRANGPTQRRNQSLALNGFCRNVALSCLDTRRAAWPKATMTRTLAHKAPCIRQRDISCLSGAAPLHREAQQGDDPGTAARRGARRGSHASA